ncbi:protein phosphatase 2C domain-containing protein [Serratia marcescens]|nr:protein phosphatase 2C domain-containing protein [Serratia marcescens]
MSRDSYEILHEQIHGWLHRKNIASSVRRVSTLPVAIATDIGLNRKENQDRVAVLKFRPFSKTRDMVVVALADGMGGMEGGANAASLTLSTFFTEIIRNSNLPIRTCLEKAVLKANNSVLNVYKGNGGSTLTAIALEDDENVTAINVGDSRIYGVSTEGIVQLSEDDTLAALARKYNNHHGEEVEGIDSRFGGELVQFIGLDGVLEIHYHHVNILKNGSVLLSSDGAHSIGKENLKRLYAHSSNTGIYSRRVIDLASWFGGFDNASVAVIELSSLLKELDVSSGDVINLWDPFGELKIISVSPVIQNEPSSSESDVQKELEVNDIIKRNNVLLAKEREALAAEVKKTAIKRKSRARSKSKVAPSDAARKKELNGNDKLENISQFDMPFSESDSVKGDENDK